MNKLLNLLDRSANWLMGVLIVAGMPLAAVALATSSALPKRCGPLKLSPPPRRRHLRPAFS